MCIDDNIRRCGLPKDPGQANARKCTRLQHISQYSAGSYGRKLIHIAYKHQTGAHRQRRQKGIHQKYIHHGHLIDDDDVRLQRILFISLKTYTLPHLIRHGADFQQSVDRGGFISCRFGHSLCRTAGRCSKTDVHILGFKKAEHLIDRGSLARAGSAGQDEQTIFCSAQYSLFLFFLENNVPAPAAREHMHESSLNIRVLVRGDAHIEIAQHSRGIKLKIIVSGKIYDPVLPLREALLRHPFRRGMISDDDLPLDRKGHDLTFNIPVGNAEKICCLCCQIPFGQIDAALSRGKSENVKYATAYAILRVCGNTDFCGNSVCRLESDSVDILCQAVGVLSENTVHLFAVFRVYLHAEGKRHTVLLQKQHSGPLAALCISLFRDISGFFHADSLDFCQPFRLLLKNPQRLLPELPDDPRGQGFAYTFDSPRPEITLNGFPAFRLANLVAFHLELFPVGDMGSKTTERFDTFAFVHRLKKADQSQLFPFGPETQNGVSVLLIPEYDVFYNPFYRFLHSFVLCSIRVLCKIQTGLT